LEGAKFTLCPSLAFYCILAALLHGTPAVCQPNFASGTTKGIRELTSPTLGRAAIRLGIDPFDDILVVLSQCHPQWSVKSVDDAPGLLRLKFRGLL